VPKVKVENKREVYKSQDKIKKISQNECARLLNNGKSTIVFENREEKPSKHSMENPYIDSLTHVQCQT